MTKRSRKALIIGAGIAGPVTAILLKKAGFDAAVYEAWPYSTGIGGGLQIAPNGMRVLNEAGLADELIRNGSHESCSERSTEGSSQLAADLRKNLASCATGILMRRNLMIWNTAIYWALVARDTVMVSLRCTLV